MELTITTIRAADTDLAVYSTHRQNWVTLRQIVSALGMQEKAGYKLFDRHRDLFTDDMTTLMQLPTADRGMQETRVFSSPFPKA